MRMIMVTGSTEVPPGTTISRLSAEDVRMLRKSGRMSLILGRIGPTDLDMCMPTEELKRWRRAARAGDVPIVEEAVRATDATLEAASAQGIAGFLIERADWGATGPNDRLTGTARALATAHRALQSARDLADLMAHHELPGAHRALTALADEEILVDLGTQTVKLPFGPRHRAVLPEWLAGDVAEASCAAVAALKEQKAALLEDGWDDLAKRFDDATHHVVADFHRKALWT